MFAAIVTGLTTLIWSYCPDICTGADIHHILKESAVNPAEGADHSNMGAELRMQRQRATTHEVMNAFGSD